MELTAVAGLPQLVKRGSNADEGMRKLWAVDCLQAAEFMAKHKDELFLRVVITDGKDPKRAEVGGYDLDVVKELRSRILVRAVPIASRVVGEGAGPAAASGPSVSNPIATVGGAPVASEPAVAPPAAQEPSEAAGPEAGSVAGLAAPAAESDPPVTPGAHGPPLSRASALDLFSLSC